MSRLAPIIAFAAPSGTGKTTLLEGVIRALVARGNRVAVLKSDAHRVVLDKPGKDSWRFSEAGAASVAVLSRLTGWWGQVRSFAVEPEVWAARDPERRAFPAG